MAPKPAPKPQPTGKGIRQGLDTPTQWQGPLTSPLPDSPGIGNGGEVGFSMHPGHGSAGKTIAAEPNAVVKAKPASPQAM